MLLARLGTSKFCKYIKSKCQPKAPEQPNNVPPIPYRRNSVLSRHAELTARPRSVLSVEKLRSGDVRLVRGRGLTQQEVLKAIKNPEYTRWITHEGKEVLEISYGNWRFFVNPFNPQCPDGAVITFYP